MAEAHDGDEIEIWGDGRQTRSFLYIDECVEGVRRLMDSDFAGPVNIGSEEMVTINQLAEIITKIAGRTLSIPHFGGPLGCAAETSDNRLIEEKFGWNTPDVASAIDCSVQCARNLIGGTAIPSYDTIQAIIKGLDLDNLRADRLKTFSRKTNGRVTGDFRGGVFGKRASERLSMVKQPAGTEDIGHKYNRYAGLNGNDSSMQTLAEGLPKPSELPRGE